MSVSLWLPCRLWLWFPFRLRFWFWLWFRLRLGFGLRVSSADGNMSKLNGVDEMTGEKDEEAAGNQVKSLNTWFDQSLGVITTKQLLTK